LFGTVENGQMLQSIPGAFVCQAWNRLPERFPDIMLDVFIVMPDHLHGIILTGSDPSLEQQANTVGFTINSFKNTVSSAWRDGVASNGWPRYQEQLWQRNYHDRIIRNEHELQALRDYIAANPARWEAKQAAR
jgi:REP element-mobilizing transposase RayT